MCVTWRFSDVISCDIYCFLHISGDFIQHLMDRLSSELDKPANEIYQHNVISVLEQALRASQVS